MIHVFNTSSLDLYSESKEIFHQVSDIIFEDLESGAVQEEEILNLDYTPERVRTLTTTIYLL